MKKLLIPIIMASLIILPSVSMSANNATRLGASKIVQTAESTNSTGFTSLATPDLVNISLPSTSYVTVMYHASLVKEECTGTLLDIVSIDGIQKKASQSVQSLLQGFSGQSTIMYTVKLAAGTHTINVLHRSDTCSGIWYNRSMNVFISL